MSRRISKRAQGLASTSASQRIEALQTAIQQLLNDVATTLQGSPVETKLQEVNTTLDTLKVEVYSLVQALSKVQEQAQAQPAAPPVADDHKTAGKKKKRKSKHSLEPMPEHPTPRDTKHTKKLPAFWRNNFDYGESPYMNIGFIEKITDEVPRSGKRKKRKKKS